MINIISRSIVSNRVSGPRKVVENLLKGLDALKYPYVVNARLDACPRVWIHDDTDALREVVQIPTIFPIVGPNLYVTPRQISSDIDLAKTLYLHPSPWVVDMWSEGGFSRAPLAAWPTGIDTEEFTPSTLPKNDVVIYFKERYPEELAAMETLLTEIQVSYTVIRYGHYTEAEYKKTLATAKYIVWIGRQESQGIALQEALAMNVPVLVWDVPRLGHWVAKPAAMAVFNDQENNFTGATSAYYFDERCGLRTKEKTELPALITTMEKNWSSFTPREYVLEQLSLAKQAKDLLTLYETHFALPYEAGFTETIKNPGKWKNAELPFIIKERVKDIVKSIVR